MADAFIVGDVPAHSRSQRATWRIVLMLYGQLTPNDIHDVPLRAPMIPKIARGILHDAQLDLADLIHSDPGGARCPGHLRHRNMRPVRNPLRYVGQIHDAAPPKMCESYLIASVDAMEQSEDQKRRSLFVRSAGGERDRGRTNYSIGSLPLAHSKPAL
jgi:hypothetical protein